MTTDAELVAAFRSGDRDAFGAIYDRYADRIHDFCHSMLRNREEAADAMQDTFLAAAERMSQLREPERLKAWLYAIARHEAFRRIRARKRVAYDEDLSDIASRSAGPEQEAAQQELRELVWSAAAGLGERDQALLDLHVRQGLEGQDLADALGVPASHAYVLLTRLRDQVERSLGALLVARTGSEECPELAKVLEGWDGRFSPLMRKRIARHVDSCELCEDRRRRMVSPVALMSGISILPAPALMRSRVLERIQNTAYSGPSMRLDRRGFPRADQARPSLRVGVGAAAAVAVAVLLVPNAIGGRTTTDTSATGLPLASVGVATGTSGTTGTHSAKPTGTVSPTTTITPTAPTDSSDVSAQPVNSPPAVFGFSADNSALYSSNTAGQCQPKAATVVAQAQDNDGIASITLHWEFDHVVHTVHVTDVGSGQMVLQPDGHYSAGLGPFNAGGTVTYWVTADDPAGAESATDHRTLTVTNTCIF